MSVLHVILPKSLLILSRLLALGLMIFLRSKKSADVFDLIGANFASPKLMDRAPAVDQKFQGVLLRSCWR